MFEIWDLLLRRKGDWDGGRGGGRRPLVEGWKTEILELMSLSSKDDLTDDSTTSDWCDNTKGTDTREER